MATSGMERSASDRVASPSCAINVPYPIERRTSATAYARARLSSTIKTVGTENLYTRSCCAQCCLRFRGTAIGGPPVAA